ncbi:MAG: DUF402 domain-containing protein [Nitrososphaerota archaeon]
MAGCDGLKYRVRGIYSTALAQLIIKFGGRLVDPSVQLAERLNLEPCFERADVLIADRRSKQGVKLVGSIEGVDALCSVLSQELDDVIVRKACFGKSLSLAELEFPALSKKRLDEVRSMVVPTIPGHHFYKACGGEASSLVDMAERLLASGKEEKEVQRVLEGEFLKFLPREGDFIDIEHVKLNGEELSLGRAEVEYFDPDSKVMRIRRVAGSDGIYDGLGVKKEVGELMVTELRVGEMFMTTRYYREDGCEKGLYINVSTPIELYPQKLRYVDLEVDIVAIQGRMEVIDEEKLIEARRDGVIGDRLLELCKDALLRARFSFKKVT